MQEMAGRIRDPRFYYSDGNAVILVEDTLFKVHRSMLSQECSAFEAMFAVAGESSSGEGHSDENPILLQGDTAEEFQALMWSLYALPREIRDATAKIERLCRCARMAHKYQFQSIESWALEVLAQYIAPSFMWSPRAQRLVMLAEVAVLCDHTGLLNSTKRNLRIAIRYKADCSLIINAAERLNLRDIEGLAYYAMMLRGHEVWKADPLLTRDQRIRLLYGFYTLAHSEPTTPPPPPSLPHGTLCQIGDCRMAWETLWRKCFTGEIPLANFNSQALRQRTDLLGKVWYAEQVIHQLTKRQPSPQQSITGMCQTSVNAMYDAVEGVLEQVSETFAGHFVDIS